MAQPIPSNYMAYDRTIVVFSPDGRLLQVEYARQMVKNGATSVGLKANNSVLLASVKPALELANLDSFRKVSTIDDHIAVVSSGSLADARDLVEIARVKAQINKVTYGEPISVSSLTTYLSNRKHLVTQYAGVRPYGVGLLVGGVDEDGPHLYETEPSGTMIEWKAHAIGRGAQKAKAVFSKKYSDDIDNENGLKLLLEGLKAGEKGVATERIEAVIIKKNRIEKVNLSGKLR